MGLPSISTPLTELDFKTLSEKECLAFGVLAEKRRSVNRDTVVPWVETGMLVVTNRNLLHKFAKSEISTEKSAWLFHFVLATEYKLNL